MQEDSKNAANSAIKLLPYQTRILHFLQFVEEKGIMPNAYKRKTKGGIFDPLTIGGKTVLNSLLLKDVDVTMRDENINRPRKSRTEPKNTLILTPNVNTWRQELKIFEEKQNLRVLYLYQGESGLSQGESGLYQGESSKNINFYSYEVVVSSYSIFKLPKNNRSLKAIKGHEWHRLLIDEVDKADNDARKCILNLNVVNKWVVAKDGIKFNPTQQQFLYTLLFGYAYKDSQSIQNELLEAYTVKTGYFHGFGSNVIQTLSIEHTHEEREPYMEAQNWVKEQFEATTRLVGKEQLESLQYFELSILKLRDMASNLSLRLKKEGNIEEYPDAAKKLRELKPDEHCSICNSSSMMIKIIIPCGHLYCEFCWYKWFNSKTKCPTCRRDVNDDQIFSTPLDCPSSKANGLVEHLKIPTSESKSSMVISSFERLLPWLEIFLKGKGFSVQRITSEMSPEERVKVLQNPTKGVVFLANVQLLISYKLDISTMDQIYLMEGVKKSVENSIIAQLGIDTERMFRAFRLIVEESVEGRIVGMNGRKTAEFKEFTMEEIRKILT